MDTQLNLNAQRAIETKQAETAGTIAQAAVKPEALFTVEPETAGTIAQAAPSAETAGTVASTSTSSAGSNFSAIA